MTFTLNCKTGSLVQAAGDAQNSAHARRRCKLKNRKNHSTNLAQVNGLAWITDKIKNPATDIELRQLPSGASVARGRIAVWKSATETTWVTLAFWDDLAIMASEHVKQGDRIFVSGRLVSDTVNEGPEKRQVYYKVVVQQFNFIESFQPVRLYSESSQDGGKHGEYVGNDSTSGSTENKKGDYMSSSSRSTEALWQAFFANPLEWWDNRKDKKNPRYPDFKHKSTGEALWVEGRNNPNWVVSQLAILDSRMGSLQDKQRKPVSYMYADDFMTSDNSD